MAKQKYLTNWWFPLLTIPLGGDCNTLILLFLFWKNNQSILLFLPHWRRYISLLCLLFKANNTGVMTLIFSCAPSQKLAPQWIIEIGFFLWSKTVYNCLKRNIRNKFYGCQLSNLQNYGTVCTLCLTTKQLLNFTLIKYAQSLMCGHIFIIKSNRRSDGCASEEWDLNKYCSSEALCWV